MRHSTRHLAQKSYFIGSTGTPVVMRRNLKSVINKYLQTEENQKKVLKNLYSHKSN